MNKHLLTSAIALCTAASALALTPEDFCSPELNKPKTIKEMRPLKDGEYFAAVSDDGRSIEKYSYKTGQPIATLFSIDAIKGEVKINDFDGYEMSDNEKKILLWNNTRKIYRNSFSADYYVYDVLRSTLRPVSSGGSQRGAVISHDGRMVAFTRDNNIFISFLDYGSEKQITTDGKNNAIINGVPDWGYEEEFGITNTMIWNKDDSMLAYMKFNETSVPVYGFDKYEGYDPQNPLGPLYPERYSYKYSLPGYPNAEVQVLCYNISLENTKQMDLNLRDKYVPLLSFDGKGVNLMAMVLNRDQNFMEFYRINPNSTVANLILTERSDTWLSPSAYQLIEFYDNSFIFGSQRTGYRHLFEYDYNGNLLRQISKGEWNVTDYYGKDKLGNHYLQTTIRGAVNRNVIRVDAKGAIKILNDLDGTEYAQFNSDKTYFIRKYSDVRTPPQFSICESGGKMIKMLEDNESYAFKYKDAPKKELLVVKNESGQDMNSFIIKPIDFDQTKRYPLLMYQYNGPESQEVLNEWKMDGIYYIASQGYIIGCVDGRGTGNRNSDWTGCVYKELGKFETEDQLAGARYFSGLPFVDSQRTACFGWSYGGYMTLMEMASEKSEFKAGIAMAPVTDWRFYDSIYTERYMLTPGQNQAGYDISSALLKAQNLKGNLLIMSGSNDDNVHLYNTLHYTSKLTSCAKNFDMMVFAAQDHSLKTGNYRTELYKKIVKYLNLNVKN